MSNEYYDYIELIRAYGTKVDSEFNPFSNGYGHRDFCTESDTSLRLQLVDALCSDAVNAKEQLFPILQEHACVSLLVHLAEDLANNEHTIRLIPDIFAPVLSKILGEDPAIQRLVFQGNVQTTYNSIMGVQQRNYPDAYNDMHLNRGEFGLARLIYQVRLKSMDLINRGENAAAKTADTLYQALNQAYTEYLSSEKKAADFSKLSTSVNYNIDQTRSTLEQHRGWTNVLANISMHVILLATTAGIGNAVALGFAYKEGYKGLMFPMVNTDSHNKVNAIVEYMEKTL